MTKIDKKKLKSNIEVIDTKLTDLAKELKNLSGYLNVMMNGDSDGPYWNGAAAEKFYKKAIGNLKNDIADYKSAHSKLNSIAEKYELLSKTDNS